MKKGKFFITLGLLMFLAAAGLTGYNLLDNMRAGKAAQSALEQLLPMMNEDPVPVYGRLKTRPAEPVQYLESAAPDEIEYPDYVLNPNMEMPVVEVNGAEYIGVLAIPALELVLPVFSSWDYTNLQTAPCRYTGSAYLDNMTVCAHNYDIHFGNLKYLQYGNSVSFTDVDGNVFNYRVLEIETLPPDAIDALICADCDLTLFTCTVGGGSRVTVRCERV